MLVGFGNLENGVAAMAHPQTTGPFYDFVIRFLYLLEYICNFCFCILYFWQFRNWVVHTSHRQTSGPTLGDTEQATKGRVQCTLHKAKNVKVTLFQKVAAIKADY